jgi:hypothetical protein
VSLRWHLRRTSGTPNNPLGCSHAPAGRVPLLGPGARQSTPLASPDCRVPEALLRWPEGSLSWTLGGAEGDRYETPAWRTWQLRGGGFPAPYSSPLVPPLTDGQQRGTLFSCQSAFPATLGRSVTDEPRNSKNVLRDARRVPQMPTGFPLSGPVSRLEPAPSRAPDVRLRLTEVAAWRPRRRLSGLRLLN